MCATHSCLNRKKSQQSKFWGLFLTEILICELGKADHRPQQKARGGNRFALQDPGTSPVTQHWHQERETGKKKFGFLLIWKSPNQSTCSRQTVVAETHDRKFLFCLGLCYLKSTNEEHGEIQAGQQPTPVCFSPVTNLPQIPAGWDKHTTEQRKQMSGAAASQGQVWQSARARTQSWRHPTMGSFPGTVSGNAASSWGRIRTEVGRKETV